MTSDNETFEAWKNEAIENHPRRKDIKDLDDQLAWLSGFHDGARASRSYHLEVIKELVEALEKASSRLIIGGREYQFNQMAMHQGAQMALLEMQEALTKAKRCIDEV